MLAHAQFGHNARRVGRIAARIAGKPSTAVPHWTAVRSKVDPANRLRAAVEGYQIWELSCSLGPFTDSAAKTPV
jgi:hypothetical protein